MSVLSILAQGMMVNQGCCTYQANTVQSFIFKDSNYYVTGTWKLCSYA